MEIPCPQLTIVFRSMVTSSTPFHRKIAALPPPVTPRMFRAVESRMVQLSMCIASMPPM